MVLKRLRGEASRQDWFGVAIELGILILGVFLGIQVSNWNQGRIDRAQGADDRQRLYNDLESNQRDMAHRISYYGKVMSHARAALAALDRPAGDNPGAFVIHAYEASNHIPQPVRRFTYDEVLASGNAEYLGDRMLRDRIANYYVGVSTMQRLFDHIPPYRETIRAAIPFAAQAQVLKDCTELFKTDRFGSVTTELPDNCTSSMKQGEAERVAAEIRSVPDIRRQLNRMISDLDQKIWNARRLSEEAERLKGQLKGAD